MKKLTSRSRPRLQTLLPIACLIIVAGCAHAPPAQWPEHTSAALHVVAIDPQGYSINPDDPGEHFDKKEEIEQLDKRIALMHEAITKFTDHGAGTRKVLLFVHGGMNDPQRAMDRAAGQVKDIEAAGYYPIFIIWNSDLLSSYGEHLAHVRHGQYVEDGWPFLPGYLFSDFGRAFARAPLVWARQAGNDIDRIGANISASVHNDPTRVMSANPQLTGAARATNILINESQKDREQLGDVPPADWEERRKWEDGNALHVSLGDITGTGPAALRSVYYFLMSPVKLLFSPVVDSTGSAAWDNMYRRSQIMFDGYASSKLDGKLSDVELAKLVLYRGAGPLERLIAMFHTLADSDRPVKEQDPALRPYEITLVGHSMGCIVLNEFIRRSDNVDYSNVAYMAAACSVRGFQQSVIQYMHVHPRTRFYNLSLQPVNDVREIEGAEVPPRGSLLVWIDDMFGNPYTPLDRTLGRWDNIVAAAFVVPPKLRGRVRLKAFDFYQREELAPPNVPQKHGDFSYCPYWSAEFWEPEPPPVARNKFDRLMVQQTAITQISAPTTRQGAPRK